MGARQEKSFWSGLTQGAPQALQFFMQLKALQRLRERDKSDKSYREGLLEERRLDREQRGQERMSSEMDTLRQRGQENRAARQGRERQLQLLQQQYPEGSAAQALERFTSQSPSVFGRQSLEGVGDMPALLRTLSGRDQAAAEAQSEAAETEREAQSEAERQAFNRAEFDFLWQTYPEQYGSQTYNPERDYTKESSQLSVAESRPRAETPLAALFGTGGSEEGGPPEEPTLSAADIENARAAIADLRNDRQKRRKLKSFGFGEDEIEQILNG